MLGVWCGHKAVTAFKVARAGDRPVDVLLIPGGEGPVFLFFRQIIEDAGLPDDLRLFQPVKKLPLTLVHGVFVDVVRAVALHQKDIILFREKIRLFPQGIEQPRGGLVPAPEQKPGIQNIFHSGPFLTYHFVFLLPYRFLLHSIHQIM